jgi:CheY-like chemotaxis protein
MGRRDNLIQVILNLVFNAADACAATAAAGATGIEPCITVRTRVEPARVLLSVDDTGPGVPEGNVRAIFQPFYTTKARGKGTGLGLKICSDVVSAHHGHIEVNNRPEGGASFHVILPRLAGTGASETRPRPTAPPTGDQMGVRRVFVVDDDELFARTVKRALKPHDVRTCASASEAELVLLDPAYFPQLVLCDLGLPGMTGDVLHGRIRARRPEIADRFVFVTGGACSKVEAEYLRASGCRTFLKPVDVSELWAALAIAPDPAFPATEGVATLRSNLPQVKDDDDGPPTLPPV